MTHYRASKFLFYRLRGLSYAVDEKFSRRRGRLIRAVMLVALGAILVSTLAFRAVAEEEQGSGAASSVVERGRFRIYRLQYPVGAECYEFSALEQLC
jgi:hypothetical protein